MSIANLVQGFPGFSHISLDVLTAASGVVLRRTRSAGMNGMLGEHAPIFMHRYILIQHLFAVFALPQQWTACSQMRCAACSLSAVGGCSSFSASWGSFHAGVLSLSILRWLPAPGCSLSSPLFPLPCFFVRPRLQLLARSEKMDPSVCPFQRQANIFPCHCEQDYV